MTSAMSNANPSPLRNLSRLDTTIIALHAVVAFGVGVIGFFQVDDPGFRDLQRLVILMMIGLWAAGIVATAVIARLIANQWARAAVLLVGPFVGIVLLVATSAIG
jgi:hypothetical protein